MFLQNADRIRDSPLYGVAWWIMSASFPRISSRVMATPSKRFS